jgi:FtsH-binding integral membrane protein
MRWAFIRKVYVIVAMQLLLTVAVAATVNLVDPIRPGTHQGSRHRVRRHLPNHW